MSDGIIVSGAVFKEDEILSRSQLAVFDKVINLRFERTSSYSKTKSYFTLRSDWELRATGDGRFMYQKCIMKPDIKVEYKAVGNAALSIKIHVSNLHLMSAMMKNGGVRRESFSYDSNPITGIKLQLGYFSQFPNFQDPAMQLELSDYYNLTGGPSQKFYTEIDCTVLGVYPTRLPPDGITTFDCVIGNMVDVFHSIQNENDPSIRFSEDTDIDGYLFEMITRRFISPGVNPYSAVRDKTTAGEIVYKDDLGADRKFFFEGVLTRDSARKYGVRCYTSYGLREKGIFSDPESPRKSFPAIPQRSDVFGALSELQNMFPDIRYTQLPSGNFVLYLRNESPVQIAAAVREDGVTREIEVLPAVYEISYSGLRSIKCPFTAFIQPFQEIKFNAKYNTGNLVSYFYQPPEGLATFIVLSYNVRFSTTGDENEMELLNTDGGGEASGQ